MKKLMAVVLLVSSYSYAYCGSVGIGMSVPDNQNVESSVIGKADVSVGVGQFLSFGLSASQTGDFKQQDKPQEVVFANANPNAFGAKKYHHHDGDVIIIEGDDITNVNVTLAPPILPKRPRDLTERNYWSSEAFLQIGVPIRKVRIYGRAGIGASGVRTYSGSNDIGLTKTVGGGVSYSLNHLVGLGVESTRRFTDTGHNTYGYWEHMAKAVFRY